MTSDEETNSQKSGIDRKEKSLKKIVVPPKSPKGSKSKKPNFLIKKLKLKSKSIPESSSTSVSQKRSDCIPPTNLPGGSVLERQTPEGGDTFILTKSASETNLKETWRSAEHLEDQTEGQLATGNSSTGETGQFEQQKILPERTKSLENLKGMVTYGELILDKATESVSFAVFIR